MPIIVFLILSSLAHAEQITSFLAGKTYRIEGTIETHFDKFLVINRQTSNEQRIRIKSKNKMVRGAQYGVCLEIVNDCHLECEAILIGKPKFITPDIEPELLMPNSKGIYAPTDKNLCP